MKSCPKAPVKANCASGIMMDGWFLVKVSAPISSDLPSLEGWMTGIAGAGQTVWK